MPESELFEVSIDGGLAVVRINPPAEGLSLVNVTAMSGFWDLLQRVSRSKPRVLLLSMADGLLSPSRADRSATAVDRESTWSNSGVPSRALPARKTLMKLHELTGRSKMLCITAVRGSVDMDLLGLAAFAHYRFCSESTVFVNNVIDRPRLPGITVVWQLSRLIGKAATIELFLKGEDLDAKRAQQIRIVNEVLGDDGFEEQAIRRGQDFASKPADAIRSLLHAAQHADLPFDKYIDEIGFTF